MRSCDVLVVGGGPAGSSCARRLVGAGLDVVVIDRAAFPRAKVCAGWVTPPVFEALGVDLEEYRRGRVLQPITAFRTGLMGCPPLLTRYAEPVSYGIRRFELDHYLLARSGARVVADVSVSRIERRVGTWVVNGELQAPMLVGAGGHFCPVARRLGGGGAGEPIVAAQEIELPLTEAEQAACPIDPDTPELYFAPDLSGYGWCVRKQRYINVGFGRRGGKDFARQARAFIDRLAASGRVPAGALRRWQGHAYLVYEDRTRRLLDDGVALVGDAAGLAYAQSGEGIRTAVESGLLAAEAILGADGHYSAARLARYERDIVARYGPRRASPSSWLPAGWVASLGARVLASPWATRHLVLDRWFLHRGQATLRLPRSAGRGGGGITVGHAQDPAVRPRSRRASVGLR